MAEPFFAEAENLLAQGRFKEAEAQIRGDPRLQGLSNRPQFSIIAAEASYAVGRIATARRDAFACLEQKAVDPAISARAHRVLADCSFDDANLTSATSHLNAARGMCREFKLDSEYARVEVAQFRILWNFLPIETALAALPNLRRIVLRSGDPHLIAQLRLAVAKAEARSHSLVEAQRHHDAAGRLLDDFPNFWLRGRLDLDSSIVSFLIGDFARSFELAKKASECAEKSGHFYTRIAAAINMSHLLELRGDATEAEEYIRLALRYSDGNRHLMRAALDSWANLLIGTGRLTESREVLDEAARRAQAESDGRPHWDAISELYSRARLAEAERRWSGAVAELTNAVRLARSCGDEVWRSRIELSLARCLALSGRVAQGSSQLKSWKAGPQFSPDCLAQYYAALAAIEFGIPNSSRANEYVEKALRLASEMGNCALTRSLEQVFHRTGNHRSTSEEVRPPDIDTAVALIELGAHPHILAREAFTAIKDAACAEAVAVVVTGKAPPRVVEAFGWTEQEAARAASGGDAIVVMPAGTHRDESWQIVARSKAGIDDYCTLAALGRLVGAAVALENYRRAEKQRAALWPAEALEGDGEAVWASEQTAELLTIARRIAPTGLSVLLTGETGTGKEMLARAIHRASDRAGRPFLPFNCAAVPRDMIESQLFGYRRGAFTGADTAFPGVIRSAAGGTLFLDEIAEVGLDLQPKLLRFLETHEIHPIGEPQPVTVDVRVIAATNGEIEDLVAEGRFRQDLFYRLNVIRLKLPPLRERREEIPSLVQHYLRRYADEQKKGTLTLGDEALEYLLLYSWPGNVRQLANEVRRMVALAEQDGTLTPALLSPEIQASRRTIAAADTGEAEVRVRLDQPLPVAVEMLEQMMVRRALERSRGRVEEASRLLGISRKGLFLKRRRWGLPRAS